MTKNEIMKNSVEEAASVLTSEGITVEGPRKKEIILRTFTASMEAFIRNAAKAADESDDGTASISFADLIDINISNRESDDGERDGNRMISFVAGPQAKLLAKKDDETEGDED